MKLKCRRETATETLFRLLRISPSERVVRCKQVHDAETYVPGQQTSHLDAETYSHGEDIGSATTDLTFQETIHPLEVFIHPALPLPLMPSF